MAAVGVSVTMRSYKHYLMLVLVPYLFLIFMFHTQLQLYDTNALRYGSLTDSRPGSLSGSDFAAQSYHVRSLRIKNASGSEDALYAGGGAAGAGGRRARGVDRSAAWRRVVGSRVGVSHDVVVQGERTMYYRRGAEEPDVEKRINIENNDHVNDKVEKNNNDDNNSDNDDNIPGKVGVQEVKLIANDDVNNGDNMVHLRHDEGGQVQMAGEAVAMDRDRDRKWKPSLPTRQRVHIKLSRHGLPDIGMNTSELLQTLMDQAGVGGSKDGLYSDAQWPHCLHQTRPQSESIEYRLSQHQGDAVEAVAGEKIADISDLRESALPTIQSLLKLEALRFQPILGNYFYSAFYDDREPEAAYMRVVALLKKGPRPALFCHFLASNTPGHLDPGRPDRVFTSMLTYYEMCENHAKDFGGWILTCEVPSSLDPLPCEVTVSLHSAYNPQQPGHVRIPVMLLRNPPVQRLDFGICVPPLFGYIPSTTLIEFIELTKILGAQHFMFYTHQIPREIQKVLKYYERVGVATVIPWDLPVTGKGIWYHGQLLAINDCLYRSMHKFKYVAFNDIDEFIVPHKHGNWTDMMHYIETVLNRDGIEYSGYSYQSAFFDPLLESSSRVLYDLESDLRTKSFSKVRTKVMVHAERIHELGIHHISKPVLDNQKTLYIEPEVAFLHHYRKCVTDFDPRMNCQVFARDESLSRYIPTLRHNVHQTMWILKEADKQGHGVDLLMANGRT